MAISIIRDAAATGRVGLLPHARKRMRKRRISFAQIIACLEKGVIVEGPYLDIHGFWRSTMEYLSAGDEVAVVVSFNSRESVVVVTVI